MKLGIFTAWRHALAKLLFCSLQCKPIAFLTFSLLSPSVVLFPHGGLGMICKPQLCWQYMSPYITYLPWLEEFSKWRPNTLYHTSLTDPPVVFPEFYYNEVVKTKLGFSWRLGSHRYSKLSYPSGTFSDIDCALVARVPT